MKQIAEGTDDRGVDGQVNNGFYATLQLRAGSAILQKSP